MIEREISTVELLFNSQHQVKYELGGSNLGALSSADTYILITNIDAQHIISINHLFMLDSNIISINTLKGTAKVVVTSNVDEIIHKFMTIHVDSEMYDDALDIPVTLFIGLLSTYTNDQAVQFLITYTGISQQFAYHLIQDMQNYVCGERFDVIDKKHQRQSFLSFLQGAQHIWSITYSSTEGNIIIRSVDLSTYRESVLTLLKEGIA